MIKKNTAIANFPIGCFIKIADGTEKATGTPAGTFIADGTAGSLTGSASYDATAGMWIWSEVQAAAVNGAICGLKFTLADCIPIPFTLSTTTKLVSDLNDLAKQDTRDAMTLGTSYDPEANSVDLKLYGIPIYPPGVEGGLPVLDAAGVIDANVTQLNGALTDGSPAVASRPVLYLQRLDLHANGADEPFRSVNEGGVGALVQGAAYGLFVAGTDLISGTGMYVAGSGAAIGQGVQVVGASGTHITGVNANSLAADTLSAGAVSAAAVTKITTGIPAAVWGYTTRTLSSFGTLLADIWAYAQRTLTQTAAQVAAALAGGDIAATIAATLTVTLTGLSISGTRTKILFTAKRRPEQADSTALLQVLVSNPADAAADGLLYINGVPASSAQRTQATLTVDAGAGTITLVVADDLMALLSRTRVAYDVKQVLADGTSSVLTAGDFATDHTPTATV
jgi:hypothetical protein